MAANTTRPARLGWILSAIFLFAMIMGPGPGIYLVNPGSEEGQGATVLGNVPVIYLWTLFWCGVQIFVVLMAYTKLWKQPADDTFR